VAANAGYGLFGAAEEFSDEQIDTRTTDADDQISAAVA
jgi:hypothetical protein